MEEQNKLTYYVFNDPNITNKTVYLFAYGDYYDFFRMYDKKNKKWLTSKISYSQMSHDFWFKEISEEEAEEITGGNLPVDDYKEYCKKFSDRK